MADEELSVIMQRVNYVKPQECQIRDMSKLTLANVLRSNYINQLLCYISLYCASQSSKHHVKFLNKCAQNLYILGYSEEQIMSFKQNMRSKKYNLIIAQFMNHHDLIG